MEEYNDFTNQIKRKLGIDLNLYKQAQMKRRLTSLRNKRGFTNFSTYYQEIDKDPILLKEFTDRITINVSEFYRNPKRWDVLQKSVLPYLINNQKEVLIWSAACSTGEEPYSLAIMLKENFPTIKFKIIATDIDETVLEESKQGIYPEKALKDLPIELKEKYFTEKNGLFYIDNSLKRFITFKKHNLLSDRYPSNVDLIVCRNVLIYFTDKAKDIIYHEFSESLREDGILFVGSTEQIFSPNKYNFSTFDTFFYQKLSNN